MKRDLKEIPIGESDYHYGHKFKRIDYDIFFVDISRTGIKKIMVYMRLAKAEAFLDDIKTYEGW